MEQLKLEMEENERQKRLLQAELDEVVSSKDDAGKNVKFFVLNHFVRFLDKTLVFFFLKMHSLEKAKRDLENQLQEKKAVIEELEDAYQLSEDAKLRLEINFQALRNDFERSVQAKEAETEEKRKVYLKQVEDFCFRFFLLAGNKCVRFCF